jgi:hypothetical protein
MMGLAVWIGAAASTGDPSMFKWACLLLAAVALAGLGWAINDARLELKRSTRTLNEILDKARTSTDTVAASLPEILAKTRTSADTLAQLSEDVRQLRGLAGLSDRGRDRSLVAYAGGVLDAVEGSGGKVGLLKKLGGGMKDVVPASEWVVGARREAVALVFVARSRAEVLDRLCKNLFGSDWYIQVDDGKPVPLREWIKANHPESRSAGDAGKPGASQ